MDGCSRSRWQAARKRPCCPATSSSCRHPGALTSSGTAG